MCSAVWASFVVWLYVGGATPTAGLPTASASLLGKLIFSANSCKLQFPHRNRCTNVVCVSNAVERWRGEAEGGGRRGRIAARWVVHMVTNVVGTPWCRRLCVICTMAKKTLSRKIQDRKIHTEEMHSCRYTHTHTHKGHKFSLHNAATAGEDAREVCEGRGAEARHWRWRSKLQRMQTQDTDTVSHMYSVDIHTHRLPHICVLYVWHRRERAALHVLV